MRIRTASSRLGSQSHATTRRTGLARAVIFLILCVGVSATAPGITINTIYNAGASVEPAADPTGAL